MDSKQAFGVVCAHGAVQKERRLRSTQGKHIKHAEEILKLLEAAQLPEKVAIRHRKARQKGDAAQELSDAMRTLKIKE